MLVKTFNILFNFNPKYTVLIYLFNYKSLIKKTDIEVDMSRKPLFITELGIDLEGMQFDPNLSKFQTHITDIMNRLIICRYLFIILTISS